MEETAYDVVATQRALTVGRIAMMGYTSLLQDYETYTQMFPYETEDYDEIIGSIRARVCDIAGGRRRY